MDEDILHATLESMGFSTNDVVDAIKYTKPPKNVDSCIEYILSKPDSFGTPSTSSTSNNTSAVSNSTTKSEPPKSTVKTKTKDEEESEDYNSDEIEDEEYDENDEELEDDDEVEQEEDDDENESAMILDDPLLSNSGVNIIDSTLEPITKKMERKGIFVMTQNNIKDAVYKEIVRLATMFEISQGNAASLLMHFRWDSERLIEKYFDNPTNTCKDAGIEKDEVVYKPLANSQAGECAVCADEFTIEQGTALPCGHTYCNDCWKGYLNVKITEGVTLVTCMGLKCKTKVPHSLIKSIVPQLYDRFQSFLVKSFVEDSSLMKWCPAPGCANAVKCDLKSEWEVYCTCGYKFCFRCSKEAHVPADCAQMKDWFKKCEDDSETGNWLSVNTKDCPKCNTAIEKNGGCNHMTCYKCRYEFCWICFGDWKKHTSCNAYKEDPNKNQQRAALERYLHYFHRYNTHEQSKKLEQNLRSSTYSKMLDLQDQKSLRWVEVQYLEAATEQLIECRRTLKYTYVYAFYLPDGSEKTLFEYLQAQLESETENLSGLLEHTNVEQLLNEKKRVVETTKVAAKRLEHLVDGVSNGLIDDRLSKPKSLAANARPAVEYVTEASKKISLKKSSSNGNISNAPIVTNNKSSYSTVVKNTISPTVSSETPTASPKKKFSLFSSKKKGKN